MTEILTPYSYDGETIEGYNVSYERGADNSDNFTNYEFISPMVPLDYIHDLQGEITFWGTNFAQDDIWGLLFNPQVHDVRLKFFVEFHSTDIGTDGTPNKSSLIFTYSVNLNVVAEFPVNGTIDYTSTRPPIMPVTQTQLNNFCMTALENSFYQGHMLQRGFGPEQSSGEATMKVFYPVIKETSKAAVYPNPTTGSANIVFELDADQNVNFAVYNIEMQCVIPKVSLGKRSPGKHSQQINLANLAPGIYIIELQVGNSTEKLKVLLSR
jgi:hypothetical protein